MRYFRTTNLFVRHHLKSVEKLPLKFLRKAFSSKNRCIFSFNKDESVDTCFGEWKDILAGRMRPAI
jgi:hypothetical protein